MNQVPYVDGESPPTLIPTPDQFDNLGGWFSYCRTEGLSVPVQVPPAISRAMNQLDLTHTEAFDWLVDRHLLHVGRGFVIVDRH